MLDLVVGFVVVVVVVFVGDFVLTVTVVFVVLVLLTIVGALRALAVAAFVAASESASAKLAPMRRKAMMAVTAFCQRLLTTYFLSFVLLNAVVLPFFAGVFASHL